MYLSKLKIFGFKSFANKVEFNFKKNGLTAVVGPNGCGKSNIIDAIRWVLGEQKTKRLRSNKMEDVIFSGSAECSAMNIAEVSLLINNDQGILDPNISQIMITRRISRSGETAYFINNQPCRLKDIQSLFYDTGVGVASYSLIEARMIDEVLSDKGDERRALFEEAAGIGKYKKQRSETKRQLERIFLNLDRVEDHINFMRKNVNSFERQAEKAQKWKRLRKELKELELSYYKTIFDEKYVKQQKFEKSIEVIRKELKILETQMLEFDVLLQNQKLEEIEQETVLKNQNQKVVQLQGQSASISNQIQRNKDRVEYLKQSIERKEQEREQSQNKILSSEQEKKQITLILEQDRIEIEELKVELEQCNSVFSTCSQEYQLQREKTNSLLEQRVSFFNQFSEIENKVKSSQIEIKLLKSYAKENQKELLNLPVIDKEKLQNLNQIFDKNMQARDVLKKSLQGTRESLVETEKQEKGLRFKFQEYKQQKQSLEVRLKTYRQMQENQEGANESYQYLNSEYQSWIKGSLSSFLKVPTKYVSIVEGIMGEVLQTLILEDKSKIQQFFKDLRENKKGSSFLFSEVTSAYSRRRSSFQHDCVKGWVIDKIEYPPFLKPLMEYILGHYLLVSNFSNTLLETIQGHDLWMITKNGQCLHTSGLNKGGDATFHGSLDRQSTIIELTQTLFVLEEKEKESEVTLEKSVQSRELFLNKARDQQQDLTVLEEKVRESRYDFENFEKEQKQALEKEKQFKEQYQIKQEKLIILEKALPKDVSKLELCFVSKEKIEEQFQSFRSKLERLETQKNVFEKEKNTLFQKQNELEHKIQKDHQKVDFLNRSQKDYQSMQLKLDLDDKEWNKDISENKAKIEEWQLELNAFDEKIHEETILQSEVKVKFDAKVLELEELQKNIRQNQNKQNEYKQNQYNLDLKLQKLKMVVQSVCEKVYEAYEIDLKDPEWKFDLIEYKPDSVQSEIASLEAEIKKQGGFSITALEDYEEEKNRLADVQEHYDDLQSAKKKLEKTITRLDEVARKQFTEIFEQIQKNFQDVFSTLFEGGKSKLVLLEEDGVDFLDSQIKINVSPSGKKMRGVALLSGGERALTSIALLFSLYLIRTSPYCIMDEVDGSLDDVNIGRFVNLLRKFSDRTQFIVVTHNKKTMASSDLLYGVTQEIKGISQLSSVRLDESLSLIP